MHQSLSLPRIKHSETISGASRESHSTNVNPERNLKFKKIQRNSMQRQNSSLSSIEIKKNINRSSSVAVGLSVEDRRNLLSQRLHFSIIEKKMEDGSYDEKEEVAMDLSSLKHKCSSYTGQINSINHNIDKLRRQIEALKSQIAIHNNDTDFITKTIREKKIQYGHLKSKVEDAQFDKSRLLSMISDRKADNITLLGTVEQRRLQVMRAKRNLDIIKKSEMETHDKNNNLQSKYRSVILQYESDSKQIRKKIDRQQQKVNRMAQNDAFRDQRKRKMIQITASVSQQEKERAFRQAYNTYLTNKVFNRFMEVKLNRLIEGSERITYLFRQATQSYGLFASTEFPSKFFNQQPERQKLNAQISKQQSLYNSLELKQKQLKKLSESLKIQYLVLGEQLENKPNENLEDLAAVIEKSSEAQSKLKIISLWSQRNMKTLESILLQKKDRSQNIKDMTNFDRITKILDYLKDKLVNQELNNTKIE